VSPPSSSQAEPFSQRGPFRAQPREQRADRLAVRADHGRAIAQRAEQLEGLRLVGALGEPLLDLDRQARRERERCERLPAAQGGARQQPLDPGAGERRRERARLRGAGLDERAHPGRTGPLRALRRAGMSSQDELHASSRVQRRAERPTGAGCSGAREEGREAGPSARAGKCFGKSAPALERWQEAFVDARYDRRP